MEMQKLSDTGRPSRPSFPFFCFSPVLCNAAAPSDGPAQADRCAPCAHIPRVSQKMPRAVRPAPSARPPRPKMPACPQQCHAVARPRRWYAVAPAKQRFFRLSAEKIALPLSAMPPPHGPVIHIAIRPVLHSRARRVGSGQRRQRIGGPDIALPRLQLHTGSEHPFGHRHKLIAPPDQRRQKYCAALAAAPCSSWSSAALSFPAALTQAIYPSYTFRIRQSCMLSDQPMPGRRRVLPHALVNAVAGQRARPYIASGRLAHRPVRPPEAIMQTPPRPARGNRGGRRGGCRSCSPG